ncbi:hypothetical protein ABG067_001987 [Albugo candida]
MHSAPSVSEHWNLRHSIATDEGKSLPFPKVCENGVSDSEYVVACKELDGACNSIAIAISNHQIQIRDKESLGHHFHVKHRRAHSERINEIAPCSDSTLATCSSDEYTHIWDIRKACTKPVLSIHCQSCVWSVSLNAQNTMLLAGTDDEARFFDLRTGHQVASYGESHSESITKVRFHPQKQNFIVSASEDGTVCYYDTRQSAEEDALESIINVESAVTTFGFFGTKYENIFCLTGSETLDLWNIDHAQRLQHFDSIRDNLTTQGIPTDYLIDGIASNELSASPDALMTLFTGDHTGNLNAIQLRSTLHGITLEPVSRLIGGHTECIRCLTYSPERQVLYTGGEDARLSAWVPLLKPMECADLSPTGKLPSQSRIRTARQACRPPLGLMTTLIRRVTDFYRKDECTKYYKLGRTLGTGSFATVRSAIQKADNTVWAVKCINKSSLTAEDEDALRVEVQVLELLQHPNIVRLRQVFDCQKTFYVVMEEMSGGELFDRIVEKEKYTEKEASAVVHKLAAALLYCHQSGIAHRDLKPENLLYQSSDEDAEIKIADFGLAKLIKTDSLMQTACGTPGYVAPEILEGKPYGCEVDVWSLGVIAYILLCGFPPFYDENNAALFTSIKSGHFDFPSPYWDSISVSAKDLINKLLVVDAKKRYTAQQVLDHAWISDVSHVSDEVLPHFPSEMRRYNARRRFRAGIMAAKTVSTLSKLGTSLQTLSMQNDKETVVETET